MLKMSTWQEVDLKVLTEVHLDARNVRLDNPDAKVEADIAADLFANEGALELVKGIADIGYLTHEIPIVVKRQGKWVVVEGNRRVAALKAIQNPMLVAGYQAQIVAATKKMSKTAKDELASVRFRVAPNQAQADQLIAAIHTANMRRPWSPARQAAFFQAQIDAGRTYKQLVSRYPTIDVAKFVFRSQIVNLFKSVAYDDPEDVDYLKSKAWARGLSTLSRIYESTKFQAITGLAMSDSGALIKSVSDETFKQMATLIIRDMRSGDLNTRSLNSIEAPRFEQLIKDLQAIHDQAEASGGGQSNQAGGESGASSAGAKTSNGSKPGGESKTGPGTGAASGGTAKKNKPPIKSRYLKMDHLRSPDEYPVAMGLHLQELSATDIERFPNSAFLLLRAVLEKGIKSFAEAKSIDIKGTGNNEMGRVQLGHAFKWLLDHVKTDGPKALIQPIESVRGGKLLANFNTTKDALDAINHNHHFAVGPDEVRQMWNSVDSIMRYVMKP